MTLSVLPEDRLKMTFQVIQIITGMNNQDKDTGCKKSTFSSDLDGLLPFSIESDKMSHCSENSIYLS